MKRALLIAGGTVGGLGAVLAITPPQLGSNSSIKIAGGAAIGATGASTSASASSSPSTQTTQSSKPVATKKATAQATASTTASATASATSATDPTTAAPAPAAINGKFTGPLVNVNYGNVQVQITVVNGRITDAVAVKAPSGKNDRYTNMAVPILKQQTLAAQSANIKGASGASYTSYGWFKSLQGAMADAGL